MLELSSPAENEARLEREALNSVLDSCGAACTEEFKKELRDRIELIRAEEETYRGTQDDPERLRQYVQNCHACSFREEAARVAASFQAQQLYAKLEAAGSNPSELEGFLRECGSACPEDLVAEVRQRLASLAISGTYSGRVDRRSVNGQTQPARLCRLTINSDVSTGTAVISDIAGQPLFELALVGKMADDQTFEGNASIINASRTYKPDNVRLIFSPDRKSVEWRQSDGAIEGQGVLSR